LLCNINIFEGRHQIVQSLVHATSLASSFNPATVSSDWKNYIRAFVVRSDYVYLESEDISSQAT